MINCNNCGAQNKDEVTICIKCGLPLAANDKELPKNLPKKKKKFSAIKTLSIIFLIFIPIILYVLYYVYLKPNPEKDGRKAAEQQCNCDVTYYQETVKANEKYLNNFSSFAFKTKDEARQKLGEYEQPSFKTHMDCLDAAKRFHDSLRNKYSNDFQFGKFDNAFTLQQCMNPYRTRWDETNTECENKINTIKNPLPDIERIKSDLIGKQTQFWNFSYLSDFIYASIVNNTEVNGRLEIKLLFTLLDQTNGNHDSEVIVVYIQSGESWIFESVRMNYITYSYAAPVGYWKEIAMLPNTHESVDYLNHKIWINLPCSNLEIMQGPDVQFDGRRCTKYYIKSRENRDAQIKITYTPN